MGLGYDQPRQTRGRIVTKLYLIACEEVILIDKFVTIADEVGGSTENSFVSLYLKETRLKRIKSINLKYLLYPVFLSHIITRFWLLLKG